MKTKILVVLLAFSTTVFAQQEHLKTTLFSFTPKTNGVEKVNGLAIGLGLNMSEKNSIQKINGLNIEINPLSIFIFMFDDPERRGFQNAPTAYINGISIGTGHSNMNENLAYSGMEISLFNTGYSCNGISVNGIYNYNTQLNGIHLSGISNVSKSANGMLVAFSNYSENMNGIQIGILNKTQNFNGLQIGIFNRSSTQKGLQIGFWNINQKRSLPFINW